MDSDEVNSWVLILQNLKNRVLKYKQIFLGHISQILKSEDLILRLKWKEVVMIESVSVSIYTLSMLSTSNLRIQAS